MHAEKEIQTVKSSTEKKRGRFVYRIVKRSIDILLSFVSLFLLSPVLVLVSICVKLDSPGPVFYKQKRIGVNGEPFHIYKFRSMCTNADALLLTLDAEKKAEYQANYKLKSDFRITRVGRFIRKTNLDELPQLINILIGQMSFIGPRPVVPDELEKYGDYTDIFLSVRPGLTGYWQVHRDMDTSYDERVQMEVYYVQNRSLKMDIGIFFRTFTIAFSQPDK